MRSSVNTPTLSSGTKTVKARSTNRFEILNSTLEDEGEVGSKGVMVQRQARAASAGVADLMKTLKSKRKGQGDKGNKASTSSEGFLISS
ncbi:hypothetical protein DITRI_Ditri07aG0019200 [Diplodiscus trichospermus]